MIKSLLLLLGIVVLMLAVTRRAISHRREVRTGVAMRHYAFTSFLLLLNVSGIGLAFWTFRRLVERDLILQLETRFVTLDELPQPVALLIWVLSVVGRCTTTMLAIGLSRLNSHSRTHLLRLYPILVVAEGVGFCIDFRGAARMDYIGSPAMEYIIAMCVWALVAWPYAFVYRFYSGPASADLFSCRR